jgi:hypothetical protein
MYIVTLVATEVVLLRKLGKTERSEFTNTLKISTSE